MDVWLKQHPKDVYSVLQIAVSFKSTLSNCPALRRPIFAPTQSPALLLHVLNGSDTLGVFFFFSFFWLNGWWFCWMDGWGDINPHLKPHLILELRVGGWRRRCTQGQGKDPRLPVCIVLPDHCLRMSGSSFQLSVHWRGLKLSVMTHTHV